MGIIPPPNHKRPSNRPVSVVRSLRTSATCTRLSPDLHPDLLPIHPKYPVFQHFLDCKKCFHEDFGDQFPVFARLSCIEKGLSKNMARILRGVKSPLASSAGGVVCFPFLPSCCVPVSIPAACVPCSLAPCLRSPCACPLQAVGLPSWQAVGLPSLQFSELRQMGIFSRF